MRDLLILGIVMVGSVAALRRPWIGVLVWTWLSLMNPHRYAWGFTVDAPLAALAAASTLVGLLFARDRQSPFRASAPVLLAVFMVWMTLSWLLGMDPDDDYAQWSKVMKIDLMIIVALALVHTKAQIYAFAWVVTMSLGLLGAKGGLFTILSGGSHRVWGPEGSFVGDNNAFALAVVMTIPLVRFLQMQVTSRAARWGLGVMMVLLAASALGSHSRGGLLAIVGMACLLWWRGRSRVIGGLLILGIGFLLVSFMPESWDVRMSTIETPTEDASVMGRFSAWWTAWNLAFHYPTGVGFNAARMELFLRFSPYPNYGTPAAHSIYFQVLGHHGFVGLALFLAIWLATWRTANKIRKAAEGIAEARWCSELAAMCQVSLAGYAVGGTFLSLAYFDLPYNLMALVVLTHHWVRRKAWEHEPEYAPRWHTLPGLNQPVLRG